MPRPSVPSPCMESRFNSDDFAAFPLRQCRRTQGRQTDTRRSRFLRERQPPDRRRNPRIRYSRIVIEGLMARSLDEPFTLYGLLAETIDIADDRKSVDVRHQPRGPLFRPPAGHPRGCHPLLPTAEGKRQAQTTGPTSPRSRRSKKSATGAYVSRSKTPATANCR